MSTAPTDIPDVHDFLDYRAFLRAWFEARKAANPRFSHRLFARLAGQKSPSLLLHVMEGRRNLTPLTLESFLGALKLPDAEASFFRDLVALDQAATDDERNEAWARIRAARRFRTARRIEGDAFDCLSQWYYAATLELARRPDFQGDPAWVARRLRPRIKASEARQALDALVSLGLLAPDEGGRLRPQEVSMTTPHQVMGLAVHNYHRGMAELARASVSDFAPQERHLLGVTVSVPVSLVPQLKAELNAMQARLLDLCDSAELPAERVYQLNLQLFPLSAAPEDS